MRCDTIYVGHKGRNYLHRCIRCDTGWQTSTPKSCDARCKKMGLGDRIKTIAAWFGIKQQQGGCGCARRQQYLNELDRTIYRYIRGFHRATFSTTPLSKSHQVQRRTSHHDSATKRRWWSGWRLRTGHGKRQPCK